MFFLQETPIREIKEIAEKFSLSSLWIKDESLQVSGTYKDRRSVEIIETLLPNEKHLALITSGNAGYSLLQATKGMKGMHVSCIIDRGISSNIKEILSSFSHASLVEVDLQERFLSSSNIVKLAEREFNSPAKDVTNGYIRGYEKLGFSILNSKEPDYIIVPFGSGEAFLGIVTATEKLKVGTKVIGVGVIQREKSFADKLSGKWIPHEEEIAPFLRKGHQLIRIEEEKIQEV